MISIISAIRARSPVAFRATWRNKPNLSNKEIKPLPQSTEAVGRILQNYQSD